MQRVAASFQFVAVARTSDVDVWALACRPTHWRGLLRSAWVFLCRKAFFPGLVKGHDAEESSCTLLVRVRFLEVLRTLEITLAVRRSPGHDVESVLPICQYAQATKSVAKNMIVRSLNNFMGSKNF